MDEPPGPKTGANVTALLRAWSAGDRTAIDQLVPLLHAELKRIARRYMSRERHGHTLQPTALVNEAYLRLVDSSRVRWQNRAHFFTLAARLMRRILVDAARSRSNLKRGGDLHRTTLDDALLVSAHPDPDLVALDEALVALAAVDPRKAQVVELKFFGGLSEQEIAQALDVSLDTVQRDWKTARAWLHGHVRR